MGGVCTAKVSEAEVMVEGGIHDILIPNQIVTKDKIKRLCSLARIADMKVVVDDPRNLRDISEIAYTCGVTIGVLIEVDTSMHRAGIRYADQGVELAKLANELPGVAFKGVMSHQSLPGKPDKETRYIEGRKYIQMCLDVRDAIEAAGIPVEVVSTGESWTYDVSAEVSGVTEVEGGSYALMCTSYDYMAEFQFAAKVLGTIISTPRPRVAVGDVGIRALGLPWGIEPEIEGVPGVAVDALQDEHIIFRSEGTMPLRVGDQFLLRSGQQDMTVNRWDQYIGVRDNVVEAVWDIPARGCHN